MKNQDGQQLPFPLDPLTYIARIDGRGEDGKPRTLQVFYEDDVVHIEDGDEFVTFTTPVLLEQA